MTGLEIMLAGGALAGKESLKKTIESIYDAAQGPFKEYIKKIRNERKIAQLFTQIAKVRKVKTLGQLDKAVDLMSFYCDSHVHIQNKKKKITSISDLPEDENILIEGIAGQGKSIFLRYLCAVELYRGQNVPVFIELRKLTKAKPLLSQILATLETYHLELTKKQLADLADSSRLVLFLDAFDEIPEELKQEVIDDIEQLSLKHERLRIFVTSRPESGLHTCPVFSNVKLSNLEGDEFAEVVNKITGDAELAEQLINQVKCHKGEMKGLLQTPLLVTLLVIRYKSYPELPQQMSDFYDSLFQVLLQRHDGSKPGYKRQRKTHLNDMQYRQAFETFCFLSKRYNGKQLTETITYEITTEVIKEQGFSAPPEDFMSDIIKITCLIVKDGEEHRFVHKSIQEFFAACYIRRKPDVVAQEIYKKLFLQKNAWRFSQELHFLSEMDRYRYYKFGELEFLKNLFDVQESEFRKSPSVQCFAKIRQILDDLQVEVSEFRTEFRFQSMQIPYLGPLSWQCDHIILDTVFIKGYSKPNLNMESHLFRSNEAKQHSFKLGNIPEAMTGKINVSAKSVAEASKNITDDLFTIGLKALKFVEAEESSPAVDKLD